MFLPIICDNTFDAAMHFEEEFRLEEEFWMILVQIARTQTWHARPMHGQRLPSAILALHTVACPQNNHSFIRRTRRHA